MTLKVFILPLLKPALLQPLCMVPALHITQITLLQHLSSALLLTQRPMLHYISASSRCDLLLDTWSAPGYLAVAGKSRMTAHSVPSLAGDMCAGGGFWQVSCSCALQHAQVVADDSTRAQAC